MDLKNGAGAAQQAGAAAEPSGAGDQQPASGGAAQATPPAGGGADQQPASGGAAQPATPPAGGGADQQPALPSYTEFVAAAGVEDEAALNALNRYKSLGDLGRAAAESQALVTRLQQELAGRPQPLPENPSAEQVAAYRKAVGAPEAPDGYLADLTPPDNLPAPQKQLMADFAEYAHNQNLPTAQAQGILNWVFDQDTKRGQEFAKQADAARLATEAQLKQDWGGEEAFHASIGAIARHAETEVGAETWQELKSQIIVDAEGNPQGLLGNHPGFLRLLHGVAHDRFGADILVEQTAGAAPGQNNAERLAELDKLWRDKGHTSEWTPALDKEWNALTNWAMNQKKGRR